MNRLIVHMAVPEAKRLTASSVSGLSGDVAEFSVKLNAIEDGHSYVADVSAGYDLPSPWRGASQGISREICRAMKQSSLELQTGGWYVAFDEATGEYVEGNTPDVPDDSSFQSFLDSVGLEIDEENP